MRVLRRIQKLVGLPLATHGTPQPQPAPKKKYFPKSNRDGPAAVEYRGAVGYICALPGYGPRKFGAHSGDGWKPLKTFDTKEEAIEWLHFWRVMNDLEEDGTPRKHDQEEPVA
jgi:hypothetical protein